MPYNPFEILKNHKENSFTYIGVCKCGAELWHNTGENYYTWTVSTWHGDKDCEHKLVEVHH